MLILIIFFIMLVGCNDQKISTIPKENESSNTYSKNCSISYKEEKWYNDHENDKWFPNQEVKKIAQYSPESISVMLLHNDTLEAYGFGDLICNPFGKLYSIKDIQKKFKDFCEIKQIPKKKYKHNLELENIYEISCEDSSFIDLEDISVERKNILDSASISVHYSEMADFYEMTGNFRIVRAFIKNRWIKLNYGIYIGMNKYDFFKKIFPCGKYDTIKHVNLIIIGDIRGEFLEQVYQFKSDTLKEIRIRMYLLD